MDLKVYHIYVLNNDFFFFFGYHTYLLSIGIIKVYHTQLHPWNFLFFFNFWEKKF